MTNNYILNLKNKLSNYLNESLVNYYINEINNEIINHSYIDESKVANDYLINKINIDELTLDDFKNSDKYSKYNEIEKKVILYSIINRVTNIKETINERVEKCCINLDISLLDYVRIIENIENKSIHMSK